MQAVVIHQCGDPSRLRREEAPTPESREDEVLAAIQGAAIRPMPLNAAAEAHTIAGASILNGHNYFASARRMARGHYENWDGSGNADSLAGEAIPREARIVHVARAYDVLTRTRAYKPAWSAGSARDFLQFHPISRGLETNTTPGQECPRPHGNGGLKRDYGRTNYSPMTDLVETDFPRAIYSAAT